MQKEDIDKLKAIPIRALLSGSGANPARHGAAYGLYRAPYRDDKTPSMKVDYAANTWYDFGTGEGGDIIDLVRKIHNADFKGAVQVLQAQSGLNVRDFAVAPAVTPITAAPGIKILHAAALHSPALLDYLRERRVDVSAAQQRCKELYYMAGDGKRYFGIGFSNDRGGYEIRNKYFKGATSKDITTRVGLEEGHICNVFEGFMDYLSHLTLQRREHNFLERESALILNSVTNVAKAKDFLQRHKRIHAYLDNDEAGRKATQAIRDMLP
jgi:hypothetical protein